MEDKRPYEELDGFFSQLPLPDEDGAWADMKKRLDQEDDDRVVVPAPFLHGCGGWALLLTGMLAAGLWFYLREPKQEKDSVANARPVRPTVQVAVPVPPVENGAGVTIHAPNLGPKQAGVATKSGAHKQVTTSNLSRALGATTVAGEQQVATVKKRPLPNTKRTSVQQKETKPIAEKEVPSTPEDKTSDYEQVGGGAAGNSQPSIPVVGADSVAVPTDTTVKQSATPAADSVQSTPVQKKKPGKRYYTAFGLSLQQQVPLAGQEWTPYNYRGRKGSLADYLPSLYLRLYREGRWFVHTEFRYGAPQYTKEFVYSQQVKSDSIGGLRTSTSYRLKKTYYHQVPLSFNWYVRPRWTVGAGVVFNRFNGAVSEREVRMAGGAISDSLISKELVQDRNDSLFRATDLQWLLETQYRWKRWSVGARYAQGLQPFIEYINDQGQPQKEKNHTLNLFIRYELRPRKR